MTRYLLAGAMAFALMSGIAAAQSTSSETSATSLVAPPVGTLSTTHTHRTIDSNGTETDSRRTTYRNEAGVADDSSVTQTTHPPVATNTTTSSSTTTTTR
jgi:hypothetical protein